MAKIGNILFSRTLKQFLECKDLGGNKGLALIEKLEDVVDANLDKILTTITQVEEPYRQSLKNICRQSEGFSEDYFLDVLAHEETEFRVAASDILSRAATVNSVKLFQRLHEPGASPNDVIEVLDSQKHLLKPEDIVNHSIKLDPEYAIQLLKLLAGTQKPVDLSKLSFQLDKIDSPEYKIKLLNYFGTVHEPKIPLIVTRFLTDSNKVVILEALKTLDRLKIDFDVSVLLPYTETMTGVELEYVLKIVAKQANAELVPHLSAYLTSKSVELNEFFARIVVVNADRVNFEKFLKRLLLEDDWNQQQAIACVQKFAEENMSEVAGELTRHELEFVRSTAQTLVINLIGDEDLGRLEEFALSDSWQVRERTIQSLARSTNRGAIAILQKQVEAYPDDFVLVLRAVRQLGFAKGLEIAFDGLKNEQANVQRSALETIEKIVSEKHASNVRDNILWSIPTLVKELKSFARELIIQITRDYDLPDVQIDNTSSTRAVEADVSAGTGSAATARLTVAISPLEMLKPGAVWMERYHIKQEIGRGMMGRVMLVEDDMVDESLVLKFMLPELTADKRSTERFKREVKYSRKVGHRNVIRVHDLLLKDDLCAISMEYFESRGLEVILKQINRFCAREGLKIMYQIASGMTAAHEQGVIHRDLKPSNVLINSEGHLKVVDFGIASAGASAESTLTQTGSIIGSPAYLAPERADGTDADERSDIYSLGIIAYFMFSGNLPYIGNPMDVIAQHRAGGAPRVDEITQTVSPQLGQLIEGLMAVNPAERPQSMVAVRDRVKALLESI